MTDTNPYRPPRSDLTPSTAAYGSVNIEEALSRGYDFGVNALLKEAQRLSNSKVPLFVVYCLAMLLVAGTGVVLFGFALVAAQRAGLGAWFPLAALAFFWLLGVVLVTLFVAGLSVVGIRRAEGLPAGFSDLFRHLKLSGKLLATGLLIGILIAVLNGATEILVRQVGAYGWLGYLVVIYLQTGYLLAIPLVVDRGLGPWRAMEASRKAISQHWFKVFYLVAALSIAFGLSGAFFISSLKRAKNPEDAVAVIFAILFFILTCWVLSIAAMVIGLLYRTIFGAQKAEFATN